MKISLITICWNSMAHIDRCVQSVLAQTRRPDEYIFVDGGSTDGTLERLETLTETLRHAGVAVRILNQVRREKEAGIPSAWNQGLEVASGDVIALLNSDDWYEPEALEVVEQHFTDNSQLEILSGPVQLVSPQGTKESILYPRCLCLLSVLMPLAHPATFIRHSYYARAGKYDTAFRISADYEFIWRSRKCRACLDYFDRCLVNMETGGTANTSRALARNETLRIGRLYAPLSPLPWLAWLLRWMSGR